MRNERRLWFTVRTSAHAAPAPRFEEIGLLSTSRIALGSTVLALSLGGCVSEDFAATDFEATDFEATDFEATDFAAAPIVDGRVESGYAEVVSVRNEVTGQHCTGALVAPRLVLTAKHCVPTDPPTDRPDLPSRFRVRVGTNADGASYAVSEVRAVPGSWDVFDGADVAVLLLAETAAERPRALSFDAPSVLAGQTFTAVGYGQRPGGGTGTKYSTTNRVDRVEGSNIFVPPTICTGDSGGPFIGADGRIWGVVSYTYAYDEPGLACGMAQGAYNTLNQYRSFLEQAIADSGGGGVVCTPSAEVCNGADDDCDDSVDEGCDACTPSTEVCNGADDDCDESVDEGCRAIGEGCGSNEECASGLCRNAGAGSVCTASCDPLRPALGCPSGQHCAPASNESCEGLCRVGELGSLALGDACAADLECASSRCAATGEGRRCVARCRADGASCGAGEVCLATAGACGACLPEGAPPPPPERGELGAPCASNDVCLDALCVDGRCARPCVAGSCGEGFECVGVLDDAGTAICRPTSTTPRASGGCATAPIAAPGSFLLLLALLVPRRRFGSPRTRRRT